MTEHHPKHDTDHPKPTEHPHVHPWRADLLSVEEALGRVLGLVEPLNAANVPLLQADGLTLAEDIFAPFDIPALPNSAMDGYAVVVVDLAGASDATPVTLKLAGQVQAGQLPTVSLLPGNAIRIMTGAPIPDGTDAIVPYEYTDEVERRAAGTQGTEIALRHAPFLGDHIRPAGEDVQKGRLILSKGRVLDPPSIGLLASFGYANAPVVRRPRVAILATGDEVQDPGETLEAGRLFDSNTYDTAAAVRRWGGEPVLVGIARDNMPDLRAKLRTGLEADFLITSAGVSAGAFDMVKDALSELGSIDFWAVRMKPARPIAFGLLQAPDGRRVPHLGLPGNPASALVALVQFGRPAIMKMRGATPTPLPTVMATLGDDVHNTDGRRVYARVALERINQEIHARLTGAQGSNLLTSVAEADGLAICPEEELVREAGTQVVVQLLDWKDHSALLTDQLDITK
jgi:molybdopterin molybdotransferase